MIGPKLRDLRQAAGLTQAEMVAQLQRDGWDISRETYAKIESQFRCVIDREVVRLAGTLRVDPGELLRPTNS